MTDPGARRGVARPRGRNTEKDTMANGIAISTEIHGKLAALRRALRGRLAGEGLAWVLIALVAAVFVTLGIDLTLKLRRLYRVIMVCVALGGLVWMVWREMLAPLFAPMPAEDLALLVERRHKQLGDRLISALQFVRLGGASPNESHAMVDETVRQANTMAAPLGVGDIVEYQNFKRALTIAMCTLALLAGFSVWQSRLMWPWLQRNVAFADVDYPQKTYLEVVGGPEFTLLRGGQLDVTIIVTEESDRNESPDHIVVHAYYPSLADGSDDGWSEERAELKGRDEYGRDFYVMEFKRVTEEFSFFVTGGDDERVSRSDTEKHNTVRLIDPPALAEMVFRAEYPTYLAHEQRKDDGEDSREYGPRVSDSLGTVSIPAGTALTVVAQATKDLAGVEIHLDGQAVEASEITLPASDPSKPRALRKIIWTHKFAARARKGKRRSTRPVNRQLTFKLTDTQGYSNICGGRKISILQDKTPVIKTKRRVMIVGELATAEAIVPLHSVFTEDHDLAAAKAILTITKGKKRDLEPAHVPLRKPAERDPLTKRSVNHEVDLRPYGFVPGDEVVIEVAADDTMPPFLGGPNVGRSAPIVVRVVRRDQVEVKLVDSSQRAIIEFIQAIALQRSVRDSVYTAGLIMSADNGMDNAKIKLTGSARAQGAVAPECKKVADAVTGILEARVLNRLGTQEGYQSVRTKIIEPLHDLIEPLGELRAAIERASLLGDAEQLQGQIVSITEAQDAVLMTMSGILTEMEKDSTRQYIINRGTVILDWSKDLFEGIKKHSDAQTGAVFDPDGKKKKKDDKRD